MPFLDDLQAALQTIIAASWTDVAMPTGANKSGFYTSVQALKLQIIEALKAETVPFPCAVLEFGVEAYSEDFAIDGDAYTMPVTVHLIDEWSETSNQNTIAAKCRTLKAAIDGEHALFQTIGRGSIDTSDANPVLMALGADSKAQIVAGSIHWPQILVLPND